MKELVRSSYMETDMIVVTPQTASAEELIDRACQAVEVEALKKRILIRKPEGERIFCKFDMEWTLEAVRNILENALKYSPEGSEVRIEIAPNEAFTCIRIQDEGIGIRAVSYTHLDVYKRQSLFSPIFFDNASIRV